tara:strand:+ start:4914 stop:5756 length:843 start_codon:yes stop_codon:yes gene_type:complete
MATIDLGKIKMVWRGAYNNATAYTIDDAVSLNGTSYICIAATTGNTPPNATYWNVLAQGGTDLGAALSNNQIAIKNNSGNIAGVNIGNAGEFLKVSSGATGYEFGAVSSDFVRVITAAGDGTAVLDVDNCFTADYENYLILGNVYTSTTTACYIRLQDTNNSEINSNYFYVGYQAYKGSSNQGNDIKTGWNQNEWSPQENIAAENEGYGQFVINVSKPYINNHYTNMQIKYNAYDSNNFRYVWSNCILRDDNTHKGFRFFVGSGNITSSSSISVYGMKTS